MDQQGQIQSEGSRVSGKLAARTIQRAASFKLRLKRHTSGIAACSEENDPLHRHQPGSPAWVAVAGPAPAC